MGLLSNRLHLLFGHSTRSFFCHISNSRFEFHWIALLIGPESQRNESVERAFDFVWVALITSTLNKLNCISDAAGSMGLGSQSPTKSTGRSPYAISCYLLSGISQGKNVTRNHNGGSAAYRMAKLIKIPTRKQNNNNNNNKIKTNCDPATQPFNVM